MRSGHGWAIAKELAERHGGGIFARLANDKDTMVVRLCGEPYACEMHWTGDGYDDCTGDGCTRCVKRDKLTTRIKLNVFVLTENGAKVQAMKIFECGPALFKDLSNVQDKYQGKFLFEIQRHGAAKSTKTKYSVLPDIEIAKLPAEVRARMDATPLHNLETATDETAETGETASPPTTPPNAPLAAAAVAEFRERLKRFPREQGYNVLLGAFGAERLTDILAAEEHKARTLIERIERGEKIPPPRDELDDFNLP